MPTPANDNFADAISLKGTSGTNGGITIDDATAEVSEPAGTSGPGTPYQTIWYKLDPGTAVRSVTLDTFDGGPTLDTVLAVYTGSSLATLTEVVSNDDSDDNPPNSNVTFIAAAGTTYWIQAGTYYDASTGSLFLNWAITNMVRSGGKVLRADASLANAFARADIGGFDEVWVSQWVAFYSDALTFWEDPMVGNLSYFNDVKRTLSDSASSYGINETKWDFGALPAPSDPPDPVAEEWQFVEFHHNWNGSTSLTTDLYVDGTLVKTRTRTVSTAAASYLDVGLIDSTNDPVAVVFLDDIKVGPSRLSDDYFADDFEGGDLSAWLSTSGDVSVVDDPFPEAVAFALGAVFSVAFDDPTLEANPTWTQVG